MTSIQSIILKLQHFWAEQGCLVLQPYDLEMGAGTSHPGTSLYALGPNPWRAAFVQPCRRPADGRYGDNPFRVQKFHQFQVILKPAPNDPQGLLLESYRHLGIDLDAHDIRFVEDDWENPSLGASGLGFEVWLDGMEITQFTYFQQVGGIVCEVVPVELAYGVERIALCLQKKESLFDLAWNPEGHSYSYTYGDLFKRAEREFSIWYFEQAPIAQLERQFEEALACGTNLIEQRLVFPAYDYCIQAGHLFNILDARSAVGASQRGHTIGRIRQLAGQCCKEWIKSCAKPTSL